MNKIEAAIEALSFVETLPIDERVEAINRLRAELHRMSPFKAEPVDFVRWERAERITANAYNPNVVAPPEMELLRLSILADGYTQPIVANQEGDHLEVVDGFHRNRVGKECKDVAARIFGYLPVVQIRSTQDDISNRMASTIRHNRARGKHRVEAMSDIVLDLKRRNWKDEKIARELGMDADEVLRLTQISGLAVLLKDFSEAWEAGTLTDEEITGEVFEDAEA